MSKKNPNHPDFHSIHLETTHAPTDQSNGLCASFRRRKLMWIIIGSIGTLLIISAVVVPTTIITLQKKTVATTLVAETVTMITTVNETTTKGQTTWIQHATTVAGGNGPGNQTTQLSDPDGMYIDENYAIYIADTKNHRIVQWKQNAAFGEVVAGGNGAGNEIDQLKEPYDVVVDTKNDVLIICDTLNERVVRWSRWNTTDRKIIILQYHCHHLVIGNNGDLYASSRIYDIVQRWTSEGKNETLVAGGRGPGSDLNQLDLPSYIFVDDEYSVYISDSKNHRVVKWAENATEGVVVAGGNGKGFKFNELDNPQGLFVDQWANVYVADSANYRIMYWPKGAKEGRLVAGGNGRGSESNQFDEPKSIAFDRERNLYVADWGNHRIQKFSILSD